MCETWYPIEFCPYEQEPNMIRWGLFWGYEPSGHRLGSNNSYYEIIGMTITLEYLYMD